jgi:hypothetical protein
MYNAWQPGVFAISGWDLCGVVTSTPAWSGRCSTVTPGGSTAARTT